MLRLFSGTRFHLQFPGFPLELAQSCALTHGQQRFLAGVLTAVYAKFPRMPSLMPSSFAIRAIGRDVSITIFTASSLNSGEKLFFGRGNYFTFPDCPS
jgi:hypothetical protein